MDEFLKILKEKHHTLSRNNAKKIKDSSDTEVMNDQNSSNITVVITSPLSPHCSSSSESNSTSLSNV
jgi:hypothetical protein